MVGVIPARLSTSSPQCQNAPQGRVVAIRRVSRKFDRASRRMTLSRRLLRRISICLWSVRRLCFPRFEHPFFDGRLLRRAIPDMWKQFAFDERDADVLPTDAMLKQVLFGNLGGLACGQLA